MADRPPVIAAWGCRRRFHRHDRRTRRTRRARRHGSLRRPRRREVSDLCVHPRVPGLDGRTRHPIRDRPLPAPQLQTLAALCGHRGKHADQRHPALRGIWWRVVQPEMEGGPARCLDRPVGTRAPLLGRRQARGKADRLRRFGTRHAALPSRDRVRGSSLHLPLPVAGMGLVARQLRRAYRARRPPPSLPSRAATSAAASSPTKCWSFQPRSCASSC